MNNQQLQTVAPQSLPITQNALSSGLMSVEQSRAIAETQAAMVVAQGRPRDEMQSHTKIMKACERPALAATAMYAYPRGGQMVEGPSIRLAEVMARLWQNVTYGMRELSRSQGESEIEAFAWDLENNVRVTRQFVVRHIRDKNSGNKALTAERDIYELAANMGQRRVRACLLELIPGDIVEEAMDKCKRTLANGDGKPLEARIKDMLIAFDSIGVTQAMIEAYLQHKVTAIVPAQLVKLQQVFKSIKDGVALREEVFDLNAGSVANDLNSQFSSSAEQPPKPQGQGETKKPIIKRRPSVVKKLKAEIDKISDINSLNDWDKASGAVLDKDLPHDKDKTEVCDYVLSRKETLIDLAKQSEAQQHQHSEKENQPPPPELILSIEAQKEVEEVRSKKTSMDVDRWRSSHYKRISGKYEDTTVGLILDHASKYYDELKAKESKDSASNTLICPEFGELERDVCLGCDIRNGCSHEAKAQN